MPHLADVSATIFIGWEFEDANVRHDQPAASTSQRNLDELEVRYESEEAYVSLITLANKAMQVHNTHIGTAKKQSRT